MPIEIEPCTASLDNMDIKGTFSEVEELQASSPDLARTETMGTVKLTQGEVVYIPAPTADPQGKSLRPQQRLACD